MPPETKQHDIRNSLSKYGEVNVIGDEMWAPRCRYKVSNCVEAVDMRLKQHLPSHLLIAGNDALLPYDGQPQHAADVMQWDTLGKTAHRADLHLPLKPYHTRTRGPI